LTSGSQETAKSARVQVSPEEWATRVDLAACYRLVAWYGWHDMIYNHISARVPGEEGAFLLNPFGLMYEEITASSLIKVDAEGNTVSGANPASTVSLAGFVIHSAIHAGRPDLACLIHIHTIAGMAISTLRCGLLALTQSVLRVGPVAYHEFEGVAVEFEERERLVRDMGTADVMVLRNHGLIAGGRSIAEAFNNIYRMERASAVQLQAMACNTQMDQVSPGLVAKTYAQFGANRTTHVVGERAAQALPPAHALEWEALLRMLDRRDPGYRL